MNDLRRKQGWFEDALLRWLVGSAVGLTLFIVVLYFYWGPGPVLIVLPWFVPAVHGFVALAAFSIAYLSFGRYAVLGQPPSFWIGVAFSVFTIYVIFYVVSWPDLVPGRQGFTGLTANEASWFYHLQFSVLAIFLLMAVFVTWPKTGTKAERWWFWIALASMAFFALIGGLSIAFPQILPELVAGNTFTLLNQAWNLPLVVAFLAQAFFSARRYYEKRDVLVGYSAYVGLLLAFAVLTVIIGGRFYDLWWYGQRGLWIAAVTIMLFGLLSEYVGLYRREREKTYELELQEQLRDEFISTAAHELKTPVTTIKGYVQLLKKWAPEKRDPNEIQAIEAINTQANRITRRVEEMIKAMRFQKSSSPLVRMRFDLGDLAAQVVQRMQALTKLHHLSIECEESVLVNADRELIEEVLTSLLDNAIKFSPKGGDIQTRVWRSKEEAFVSVRDYGIGIAKTRQQYVFMPFYELVPSGVAGYSGTTALGLYLSRLTIERHQGRIWLESEEGKGSTFYFSLPLAQGEDNGSPA